MATKTDIINHIPISPQDSSSDKISHNMNKAKKDKMISPKPIPQKPN